MIFFRIGGVTVDLHDDIEQRSQSGKTNINDFLKEI